MQTRSHGHTEQWALSVTTRSKAAIWQQQQQRRQWRCRWCWRYSAQTKCLLQLVKTEAKTKHRPYSCRAKRSRAAEHAQIYQAKCHKTLHNSLTIQFHLYSFSHCMLRLGGALLSVWLLFGHHRKRGVYYVALRAMPPHKRQVAKHFALCDC